MKKENNTENKKKIFLSLVSPKGLVQISRYNKIKNLGNYDHLKKEFFKFFVYEESPKKEIILNKKNSQELLDLYVDVFQEGDEIVGCVSSYLSGANIDISSIKKNELSQKINNDIDKLKKRKLDAEEREFLNICINYKQRIDYLKKLLIKCLN